MSDLQNPIFEDEKELLERQRLEYKNALLNDVSALKDQTSQVGKGALLLGGALAGVWIVTKIVSGGKKRKKNKKKKAALKRMRQENQNPRAGFYLTEGSTAAGRHAPVIPLDDEVNFGSPLDFNQISDEGDSALYNTQAKYFNPDRPVMPNQYSLHSHYHAAAEHEPQPRSFLESDFVKSLATQALAFALVYLSKKAEEFVLKNTDIATEKGFQTHDVDFTDLNTDAGEHL